MSDLRTYLISAALSLALTVSAGAATQLPAVGVVKGTAGKVLVNSGSGFVPAGPATQVNVGDKIMLGEDGQATLWLTAQKCAVPLSPFQVTTVSADMGCQPAALNGAGMDAAGMTITPASYYPAGAVAPTFVAVTFIGIFAGALALSEGMDDAPLSAP